MKKIVADLLKLFILLNLLVLALFTIPVHEATNQTPTAAKQTVQENLVTVIKEVSSTRQRSSF